LLDTNKQAFLSKMQDFVRLGEIVLDYWKTSQLGVRRWTLTPAQLAPMGVASSITQLSTIDY
jgi:hypothetical protein